MGLDEHLETIYRENDMDPLKSPIAPGDTALPNDSTLPLPGTSGSDTEGRPNAFVLFERGTIQQRIVHDRARIEQRRVEREHEALAQSYAAYAQSTASPVTFEQYMQVLKQFQD